jgi:hypothetical protein
VFTDREQIDEALRRTGRRLALSQTERLTLLVCGGSALNLSGVLQRPTRDVDVLGMVATSGSRPIVTDQSLPPELQRIAAVVAEELNLPEDWLNDSALDVQRLGLPSNILRRTVRRDYGPSLTVLSLGRRDLVALKLYASLDGQKGQRHLNDLLLLKPTRAEIAFAVGWLLDRPTSKAFRDAVSTLAAGFGFQRSAPAKRTRKASAKSPPAKRRPSRRRPKRR